MADEGALVAEQLRHTLDLLNAELEALRQGAEHERAILDLRVTSLEHSRDDHEARLRNIQDGVTSFKVWTSLGNGGAGAFEPPPPEQEPRNTDNTASDSMVAYTRLFMVRSRMQERSRMLSLKQSSHLAHDVAQFLRKGLVVHRIVHRALDDHRSFQREGLAQ